MIAKRYNWLEIACMAVIVAVGGALAAPLTEHTITNPVSGNIPEVPIWCYANGGWDSVVVPYSGTDGTSIYAYSLYATDWDAHTCTLGTYSYPWAANRLNFHMMSGLNAPDGILYLEALDIASAVWIWKFDPATHTLTNPGAAVASGVLYGGDNKLINISPQGDLWFGAALAGGHRNAFVKRVLSTQTDTAYTHGGAGMGASQAHPIPNGFGIDTDGDYIYSSSGRSPYGVGCYRISTDTDTADLPIHGGGTVGTGTYSWAGQYRYGARCSVTGTGGAVGYWCYHGEAYPVTTYPTPPWPGGSTATTNVWLNAPTVPVHVADGLDTPDPATSAVTWNFTYGGKTLTKTWTAFTYTSGTRRVFTAPDGRIWVTCGSYMGSWYYDPTLATTSYIGGASGLSHYGTAVIGTKAYLLGYPSGSAFTLDTALPWTLETNREDGTEITQADADANPHWAFSMKQSAGTQVPQSIDALTGGVGGKNGFLYAIGQDRQIGRAHV
jgi:hypothetical protein